MKFATDPPAESSDALSGTFTRAETEVQSDSVRMMNLAQGQSRIIEMIAMGAPLKKTLTSLLEFLERDVPDMYCSVLLLDVDGVHLRHCAAPRLPEEYTRKIDGSSIGPNAGSCGTAAYRGERVIVADIELDPLWSDYRDIVRPFGFRACWSTPIQDAGGAVLGTFAMYFMQPASPTPLHERLTEIALHVASIAIAKQLRENEQKENNERYNLVSQATKDVIWDWDVQRQTLWWNDSLQSLFGYAKEDVTSDLAWWTARVHEDDRDRAHHSLQHAADVGESWSEDYRFLRKDGSYAHVQDRGYVMRDSNNVTIRMIGSMQDITERKLAEARILELAYSDPLTHLPNRAALQLSLESSIRAATEGANEVALMLVNLNCFRDINNCLGHQNGDLLIQKIAQLFRSQLSAPSELAALGGDEFAILLPQVRDNSHVEETLACIRRTLDAPIQLGDIPLQIEATIGVAIFPQHGATAYVLWQHADVALRTAKENFDRHLVYSPAIDHYDPARIILLGELHEGIHADQLILHYQPKIDLNTGRTCGIEALVRWQHPTRGLIFPDTFIPLAERTGLINPLTTAVVIAALKQGVAFRNAGLAMEVSVNLSARNLHEPGFAANLLALASSVGFPLSELTLELTETAIMNDPVHAKAVLAELADAGIHLSMDDFGIGQSSLSLLKELPISKIKIDKSFVMELDQSRNVAVVRSAIDLARNMDLEVTAEGIETEATLESLRAFGCQVGQGYFFSRPVAADKLETWLAESRFGMSSNL